MDPGILMALSSVLSSGLGGLTGSQGEKGSTYGKNQLEGINDILSQIKGRGGVPDITQNQNYQQGNEWLQGLFNDPQFFQNIEAPAMRQFNEEIVPGLANRFASMGSGGSTGSTAFRNQLGREGSNLATNLAANRTGLQQQGVNQGLQYGQQPINNIMQMLQQALQPTQNTYQGPSQGFFGGLAAPFASGAANIWGQQAGQQAGMQNGQQGFAGQSPLTMSGGGGGYGAGWDSMFRQPGALGY